MNKLFLLLITLLIVFSLFFALAMFTVSKNGITITVNHELTLDKNLTDVLNDAGLSFLNETEIQNQIVRRLEEWKK